MTTRRRFAAATPGAEVLTTTPKETNDFLGREARRWGAVIQRAGNQLERNA